MGSGSGQMTPVGGGIPGTTELIVPLPYTFLSIHRYAKIMGINPLHFAGGATPDLNPVVFPTTGCSSVWKKYDWQGSDQVGHIDLAHAIHEAEQEITRVLGYPPAPDWIADEDAMYPRPYRRYYSSYGLDVSGRLKSVRSGYGKVINGGRRAVSLIGTASTSNGLLEYIDEDSDNFYETAKITVATSLTDIREIKLYHEGLDGDREWEIRPVRSKRLSGGNAIIVVDSWLLIDPELYELYPTDAGFAAINVSTISNFVPSVDVYREYNDTTQAASQFIWENDIPECSSCGGVGCEDCDPVTQDGCMTIRDDTAGMVTPFPASYSDGAWTASEWTEGREPDKVKLWYYAGDIDQLYRQNRSYDPLSHTFAQAIAWLATARLNRDVCGCSRIEESVDELRMDMAHSTREKGTHFLTPDAMASPFGTRKGEVMAWRRINKLATKRLGVAVI